jgi:uncharacterized protein (DUF1786 family)
MNNNIKSLIDEIKDIMKKINEGEMEYEHIYDKDKLDFIEDDSIDFEEEEDTSNEIIDIIDALRIWFE